MASLQISTSGAVFDVVKERLRQQGAEGWNAEHDDQHVRGELAQAAACYAHPHPMMELPGGRQAIRPAEWPNSWGPAWWKPKDRRRDLVRAAALIIAEIERLDRAEAKASAK